MSTFKAVLYLVDLPVEGVDLLPESAHLAVFGHQLQSQVGALTLQLVRLCLVALGVQRQRAVLLKQVRTFLLLEKQQWTGQGLGYCKTLKFGCPLCLLISNFQELADIYVGDFLRINSL